MREDDLNELMPDPSQAKQHPTVTMTREAPPAIKPGKNSAAGKKLVAKQPKRVAFEAEGSPSAQQSSLERLREQGSSSRGDAVLQDVPQRQEPPMEPPAVDEQGTVV